MPQVLLTQPVHEAGIRVLESAGMEVVVAPSPDRETVLGLIGTADGMLVRTTGVFDGDLMDHAPRLKVIGRHGVGVDHIDLAAAAARGVTVVNAPEANSQAVAEYVSGMMVSLVRFLPEAHQAVLDGEWSRREKLIGRELLGSTLGIIGLGRVGSRVARICGQGFGVNVLYYDIVRKHEFEESLGVTFASFDEVVAAADILTLHVPLTPLTRHMMNTDTISAMKRGSYLINASRGEVVDINALDAALGSGHLAGAGVDVFPEEPMPTSHPLLQRPNVVLSPHMASHSEQAVIRMSLVAEDIVRVLRGETPKHPVVPEA